MTTQSTSFDTNDQEIVPDNNKPTFETTSFVQNDILLSLIYFGLIIFSPMIFWNHVDHTLIFTWQGGMIAISAARWCCRLAFLGQAERKNPNGF